MNTESHTTVQPSIVIRSIQRNPPQPTAPPPLHTPAPPTRVGWCGFLTDRSPYRYEHRDTIQPPVIIPIRPFIRVLCRAVGCYLDPFSAVRNTTPPPFPPPHPAYDTLSLSEIRPSPPLPPPTPSLAHPPPGGRSWAVDLCGIQAQATDLHAFGLAFVHLLTGYHRACALTSQRQSGTFAERTGDPHKQRSGRIVFRVRFFEACWSQRRRWGTKSEVTGFQ